MLVEPKFQYGHVFQYEQAADAQYFLACSMIFIVNTSSQIKGYFRISRYNSFRTEGDGAVAGIVICLLDVGAIDAFLVIKRKSWRLSWGQDPEQNEPLSPLASGLKRKS